MVLEHFQDPRNAAVMADADAIGVSSASGAALTTLYFRVRDSVLEKVTFQAFGCGFLIACCSALTELVAGRHVRDCQGMDAAYLATYLGGLPPDKQFCAALAVAAMRDGLEKLCAKGLLD